MIESDFDSEVMQLIADLALVRIGSPEFREWLAIRAASCYTNYWFCERWLDMQRERNKLMRELYKRNKPYSKYVYESLSYQTRICWQGED